MTQRHACGVFDFVRLGGAAPTALGGSPEVFLISRNGKQRLAPMIGSKTPSPDTVIGASACTVGLRYRAMVNKSLLLLIKNTSGEPVRAGAEPLTPHA